MAEPKYHIRRYLYRMPGRYQTNVMKLAVATGHCQVTIEQWQKIELGAKRSISVDDIYKCAAFFDCEISELINTNGEAQK